MLDLQQFCQRLALSFLMFLVFLKKRENFDMTGFDDLDLDRV